MKGFVRTYINAKALYWYTMLELLHTKMLLKTQ